MAFGKNKLTGTLAKVTAFIAELNDGIEANETKVYEKTVEIQKLREESDAINEETAVALKLLEKFGE
jgi:hypothetical protein